MSHFVYQRLRHSAESTLATWVNMPSARHYNGRPLGSFAWGIEDEPREEKLARETRIPANKPGQHYILEMRTEGNFAKAAQERWGHPGVFHIRNVPGFTYCLVHWLNDERMTEGCLSCDDEIEDPWGLRPRHPFGARDRYRKMAERYLLPVWEKCRGIYIQVLDEPNLWGDPAPIWDAHTDFTPESFDSA